MPERHTVADYEIVLTARGIARDQDGNYLDGDGNITDQPVEQELRATQVVTPEQAEAFLASASSKGETQ